MEFIKESLITQKEKNKGSLRVSSSFIKDIFNGAEHVGKGLLTSTVNRSRVTVLIYGTKHVY